jgi:hypothetical protein
VIATADRDELPIRIIQMEAPRQLLGRRFTGVVGQNAIQEALETAEAAYRSFRTLLRTRLERKNVKTANVVQTNIQ